MRVSDIFTAYITLYKLLKSFGIMRRYITHLRNLYFDIKNPAGFSNIAILYDAAKKKFPEIKRKDVKDFLISIETYTYNRPRRIHFPRDKIYAPGMNIIWELDLTFLLKYEKQNSGYKYILFCIDVFSKYLYAEPLRRKKSTQFIDGFKKVLGSTNYKPLALRCDSGGEFLSKKVEAFLKKENIHLYTSKNEVKSAIVERVQRTIKGYLFRYFQAKNTNKWIDVLPSIVNSYNNRVHRSIGMKPVDVNFFNSPQIFKKLYPDFYKKKHSVPKFLFNIGCLVRITLLKDIFSKGFNKKWSSEIYTIHGQIIAPLPRYVVKSLNNGDILKGSFLAPELQQIGIKKNSLTYTMLIRENNTDNKILLSTKNGDQSWFTRDDIL